MDIGRPHGAGAVPYDTRPEGELPQYSRGRESLDFLISVETTFVYMFFVDFWRACDYCVTSIKRLPRAIFDLFKRVFRIN